MEVEDPPKNLNQKEKTQWNISWAGLPEVEVSTKLIVPQSLSTILITKLCLWNIYSKILVNRCWKLPIP